jgi:Porphyromonas-type peptidyl-arginine deiminase
VELNVLPPSERWSAATEPGALRRACSRAARELQELFDREGLPFRRDLIQRTGENVCHVFYRPTVPGFRAAPDDEPIKEILFDSDSLLYLAASPRNRGEPVGAMREVLGQTRRPLDVGIFIHPTHDAAAYEAATIRNFGKTPHRITLLDRGVDRNFWWVQDYLKSGTSSRGPTILVPYRLFEGSPETGETFEPLLARLAREERAVRSRLSWEGGDLQFTRDPRDPRRLVLYYGNFAKPYWAETLTQAEFEYVLSLEFGADRAVDLSGLAPHVDYFVAFLPREKAALVSVPVSGDLAVARAVAERLSAEFGEREPTALAELRRGLSPPEPDPHRVREILERARQQQSGWAFSLEPGLADRMESLVARVCPEKHDCFSPTNRLRMIEADPALFEAWVHAVQRSRDEQTVITAHLDLVESQLEPVPEEYRRRTLDRVAELERTGLRVIRMPAYRVNLTRERGWPGISYVNGLVVDQQIFLPRFGLGDVEDELFRDVGARLPSGYSIVPIDAQRVLIRNGGLHCLAGLVR